MAGSASFDFDQGVFTLVDLPVCRLNLDEDFLAPEEPEHNPAN